MFVVVFFNLYIPCKSLMYGSEFVWLDSSELIDAE